MGFHYLLRLNNALHIYFLINAIYSYYVFPFKYHRPNLLELSRNYPNLSKEEIYFNYLNSLSIYTLVEIENSKIYEMFFNSKEKCTFLTNKTCISERINIPKQNHTNSNISKIFEFINKNNSLEKCISGEIGLALPGYINKLICFPMISEIKNNDNTVKSLVWSIKYYNDSQNNYYDGEIIIGMEPHEYEPSIYNESDYYKLNNYINEEYYEYGYINNMAFTIKFEKVYFYINSNEDIINEFIDSDYNEASLEFELGMIKCPFIYFILIKEYFFEKFINSSICKEMIILDQSHSFICDKNKLNMKISEFYKLYPSIYFYSFHLNYTFVLKGEDLFLEKDDKLYFMVFSKNENINNWRLGDIFFKKYFLTFNHDSKTIGFYIKNLKEDKNGKQKKSVNKEKHKINYSIIIFILGIVLLIIEIGFCIYCFYKKGFWINRKKRANELVDDNYDYQTIN